MFCCLLPLVFGLGIEEIGKGVGCIHMVCYPLKGGGCALFLRDCDDEMGWDRMRCMDVDGVSREVR